MAIKIETLTVGQLQTNCYLVYDKDSRETLIIDPGDEATFITDEILRLKLKPTAIIATHGHFDHILAAWELQMAFNIPFYIHPKDNFLLNRMQSSAKHWLGKEIVEQPPENILSLAGGRPASLQGVPLLTLLTSIETPGHTPGSICLIFPKEKVIFTGDTLFAANDVGRTDLAYSFPTAIRQSISLLKKKYKSWSAHPGHGESFTI